MNKKIKIIFILSVILFTFTSLFAQETPAPEVNWKIIFANADPYISPVYIMVIPVSMVMNGNNEYNLHARWQYYYSSIRYDYISTACLYNGARTDYWPLTYGTSYGIYNEMVLAPPNSDGHQHNPDGAIGAGIYKFIFYWGNNNQYDTMWFEQDANQYTWQVCDIYFAPDPINPTTGKPILEYNIIYSDNTETGIIPLSYIGII